MTITFSGREFYDLDCRTMFWPHAVDVTIISHPPTALATLLLGVILSDSVNASPEAVARCGFVALLVNNPLSTDIVSQDCATVDTRKLFDAL
jgi:hypothetical protein